MGNKLFHQIIELTGLPENEISNELHLLLKEQGIDPDFVTLEQMREVLAAYLRRTLKGPDMGKLTS